MADAERVTARQRAILTAIVENYIETGEPVGSGTIARVQASGGLGAGLSSATVRNEMAELANEGLLEQPHTSAGRVPTARAFRMYVERLSGEAGMGRGGLLSGSGARGRIESQIDSSFAGVSGTQAMLERTSHVLATVSSGVGVAMALVAGGDTLEHVHFSRLGKGRVLAVPDSAVIYGGRRELILVDLGEGRYEAREVKLGVRADDFVEVLKGIGAGEKVVVSANFLIDAESNLKAVVAGFSQGVKNEPGTTPASAPAQSAK